jgi:LmbE family N-acetylglucosaminyl deacetylase
MIKTYDGQGNEQEAWRPKQVFHAIQDRYISPDFIVDITDFHDKKVEAIMAFKSQFHVPDYKGEGEPQSYISSPEFLEFVIARAQEMGHAIGVRYGEGFTTARKLGVRDLSAFI